jgi:hypothetical protein
MKAGEEHVVPLCDDAMKVLERAAVYRRATDELVFPARAGICN